MRARHLDDTHRRAGIKGCDALRGCSPPATRGAPHRASTRPLIGYFERRTAARAHPFRNRSCLQDHCVNAPYHAAPENIWTKCYQYET
jgi:hypothetical protein